MELKHFHVPSINRPTNSHPPNFDTRRRDRSQKTGRGNEKIVERPIEDENVKGKLEEAIKGYELLFEHPQQQQETQVTSPPLSITNNS